MNVNDKLLTHPQPVDKTAALHIAGGDKLGRDELLWAQHETFERALAEVRLHNMEEEQERRRALNRHTGRYIEGMGEKKEKAHHLETKHPRSFVTKDWRKHMRKMNRKSGAQRTLGDSTQYDASLMLKGARSRGRRMEKLVERVTP